MTRILAAAGAVLAFSTAGALACPAHQSAHLDNQTVASVAAENDAAMSTPTERPQGGAASEQGEQVETTSD